MARAARPALLLLLAATLGGAVAAHAGAAAPAPPGQRDARKPPSAAARVLLDTALGEIELEVDLARAPVTARNFLRYVDAGRYDGGRFHRTVRADNQPGDRVRIAVVQAGVAPAHEANDFPPIPLEPTRTTGLAHRDGTISMARAAPDTATSDFFICMGDQPELDYGGRRNPDGQGFAAFGRVVRGMDVVRKIHAAPADAQALAPPTRIARARRR
jgi:peptidyl-prolyl cis-trans isomerase A (cyclophilin A)